MTNSSRIYTSYYFLNVGFTRCAAASILLRRLRRAISHIKIKIHDSSILIFIYLKFFIQILRMSI